MKHHLDSDPFIPFRVVLTSGTHYDVRTPYQVGIGQTQFDYYFPKSDRKATVRLNQMVALKTLEPENA